MVRMRLEGINFVNNINKKGFIHWMIWTIIGLVFLVTILVVLFYEPAPIIIVVNESTNISSYGNLTDSHNCKVLEGYSYCELEDKCYQPWKDSCKGEEVVI